MGLAVPITRKKDKQIIHPRDVSVHITKQPGLNLIHNKRIKNLITNLKFPKLGKINPRFLAFDNKIHASVLNLHKV